MWKCQYPACVVQHEIYRSEYNLLILQFCVPGSSVILAPEIYVTVIGHSPLINCRSNQVYTDKLYTTPFNTDTRSEIQFKYSKSYTNYHLS